MTRHALDLTRHKFVRTIGDITVYGTWLYSPDKEDTEPALVLVPAYRRVGFKPVAIALSAAFKYESPQYMARACKQFLKDLDLEDNSRNAFKVAEIILEHLPDLIAMPPDPTHAVVVGEATVHLLGGKKHTAQLLDHEQDR